ncbi:unnamed protein product [Nyctereutes procyonoides]|uniref:(raccoon dog) hypothetical protein n=1 Tax=Nyctereutes procyonoides TaxID=34880 RepID=A0A811Z0Y4_NYCPR|nr:unnamed protein product [Nyctereutes procyonoides]
MEPPPASSQEGAAYRGLGVEELRGERPDTKPVVISVTAGDVEKNLESEPELGAEAAAEESHGAAGAPGPVDDENQRGGGGGGDEEQEEQPPQQQDEASAAAEGPQPQDPQQRLHRGLFTRLELKELESVFQRAQYPDVFARKDLTICVDVSETSKPEKSNLPGEQS